MKVLPKRAAARLVEALLLTAPLAACAVHMEVLRDDPGETAFLTRRPWGSMVYLADTDSGVIAIDLGWRGDADAFDDGLAQIGGSVEDVGHVFITHSHRDHIAGWQVVPDATFHLHEWEADRFHRESDHLDFPSTLSEALDEPDTPAPGEIRVEPFGRDTAFALGSDTVFAYSVPGHTAGSSAYRFRDILFVGDAISYMPLLGFHGPSWFYSENREEGALNLAALYAKIEGTGVRWLCTSHGKCAELTPDLIRRTAGEGARPE